MDASRVHTKTYIKKRASIRSMIGSPSDVIKQIKENKLFFDNVLRVRLYRYCLLEVFDPSQLNCFSKGVNIEDVRQYIEKLDVVINLLNDFKVLLNPADGDDVDGITIDDVLNGVPNNCLRPFLERSNEEDRPNPTIAKVFCLYSNI